MLLRLPHPGLPTGARRRLALVAGVLAVFIIVGSLAIRPLVIAFIRHRLGRVGTVTSLAVQGSTLNLLQGKPTSLAVQVSKATVGTGWGSGSGAASKLATIDRVDFAADMLHTKELALDNVTGTIKKGTVDASSIVPSQSLSLLGQQVQITPKAVNGNLELTWQNITLIVTVADGQPNVTIASNGQLAGQQIPLSMLPGGEPLPDIHINSLTAHHNANHIELNMNGYLET